MVGSTICYEIQERHKEVVIDNVADSPVWSQHYTPLQYGFQSYISVPIILGDGSMFGTLCAIDPKPADLDNLRVVGMFKLFADLNTRHLDARERVIEAERPFETEIETAHLRDQFIGILGHDIRNPIASIMAGAKLLRPSVGDKRGGDILNLMEQSATRAAKIVENVMDYAPGVTSKASSISSQLSSGCDECRSRLWHLPQMRAVDVCRPSVKLPLSRGVLIGPPRKEGPRDRFVGCHRSVL